MKRINNAIIESAAKTMVRHLNRIAARSTKNQSDVPTAEQAMQMMQLNLTQQCSLVERAKHFISIKINHAALDQQLQEIQRSQDQQELENQFLLLGAPLGLMRRLFGMHATEFSLRRKLLHLQGSGAGRPINCDEETEHHLWKEWESLSMLDEKERFLRLSETTGMDLQKIWSALRSYVNDESSMRA